MILPADSIIARAKLTKYLLVLQPEDDKSKWLALAGYTLANSDRLEADLRAQVLTCEAVLTRKNAFGSYFEIRAPLTGPNGRTLTVRTIWQHDALSGVARFVTLYPSKRA